MMQESSNESVQIVKEVRPSSTGPDSNSFGEGIEIETSHTAPQMESRTSTSDAKDPSVGATTTGDEKTAELLGKLPPEIAMLLVIAGIAGILLPGPVGMPLLIAGGVTLWPKTFQPMERWFSRRFPLLHREGVFQIKEFLSDLEKRFPEKKSGK